MTFDGSEKFWLQCLFTVHKTDSYFLKSSDFSVSFFYGEMEITNYSTANPHVSSTACVSLSSIFSLDSYGGRSNRLKQVCALGKLSVGASIKCRVNKRGPAAPVEPCKALKPCRGTCSIVKWHLITFALGCGVFVKDSIRVVFCL